MKLGRIKQFDERSRGFNIRTALPAKKERSYTWRCLDHFNQGQEGACVGFSWAHELLAKPKEKTYVREVDAHAIYKLALTLDAWPGENYEGTSVLAGVKAVQKMFPDAITEYRWAFSFDDLIMALGYKGPAVLGINWYESMYEPWNGIVEVRGDIVGGHAILAKGVNINRGTVTLHNSWGEEWGNGGDAVISFADLKRLLKEDGEACIPLKRN